MLLFLLTDNFLLGADSERQVFELVLKVSRPVLQRTAAAAGQVCKDVK